MPRITESSNCIPTTYAGKQTFTHEEWLLNAADSSAQDTLLLNFGLDKTKKMHFYLVGFDGAATFNFSYDPATKPSNTIPYFFKVEATADAVELLFNGSHGPDTQTAMTDIEIIPAYGGGGGGGGGGSASGDPYVCPMLLE